MDKKEVKMDSEKIETNVSKLLKRYQKSWRLLKDFFKEEERNQRRDLGESSFMCMKAQRKMNELEQDIILKEEDGNGF